MNAWAAYAAVGGAVTLAGAGLGNVVAPEGTASAVWFAAGVAYALQLLAFAVLVAVRDRPELFVMGWLGGLVARFGAVGGIGLWLARDPVLPIAVVLLSLVGFVFVLLLLEPLFLRRGVQTR